MDNLGFPKIPLKSKATKAIAMTIILLISLALPLLMVPFAAAAPTISISPSSGPNGTAVSVTGTGFAANDATGAFTVLIDGLAGKVTLSGSGLSASKQLASDASGKVTGYFIIGGAGGLNLAVGSHSVQISDAVASPVAVSFTITAPTVTLTPSAGPAGTSVKVTASGFASGIGGTYTLTNTITACTFAGTAITVNVGSVVANALVLSSDAITNGAYTGTVSLPGITTGSSFTLTDNLGNVATTNFALNTPTVTLSPTSGPTGTLVTVTATGFGPTSTISTLHFGSPATVFTSGGLNFAPSTPAVTEQGTTVFQFVLGTGTADYAAGAHPITVTDSLGNVGTASFTVTPRVTLTLGVGAVNSGVPAAPTGVANVVSFLSATGFKANTLLSITGSPGLPAGWITFAPATITTDANGAIAVAVTSGTGTAPPSGSYSMTISDGTSPIIVTLTITNSYDFFVISPISGAKGTTVTLTGFLATPATTTAINFDGAAVAGATQCAANTWPNPPTPAGSFAVPSSGAGPHQITATGIPLAAQTFTNTGAPTIDVVSPDSASVGTTMTIVGSGFANNAAVTGLTFTIDGVSVLAAGTFTTGSLIATFTVPAFLTGVHTLSATDSFFNTASASITTSVSSISVTPTEGILGGVGATSIEITGSGFPATTAITVSFDGTPLAAATVGCSVINTNGGIILYTTSIPGGLHIPAGIHTITVTAGTGSATADFIVHPIITLGATAVRPGATVAITGAGFASSSALSLYLNGTATTWFLTVAPNTNATTVTSTAVGDVPASEAVIITSATEPQALNITVVDAAGNAASKILTILATPSINVAAPQGISGVGTVGISGAGFTPGAGRVASVDFIDPTTDTVLAAGIQTASPITVGAQGTFTSAVEGFTVPAVPTGSYIVSLTLTVPTESANATFMILGAASVTANPAEANVGGNITVNIVGLQAISVWTLGSTNILGGVAGTDYGSLTVPTSGPNAYNLTTWFKVPALTAGPFTLLVSDGTRSATTTVNVTASITLTPTAGILKGSVVTIAGTGFAVTGTAFTVSVNGAAIPAAAGTTGAGGTVATSFTVPVTAGANNSVTVTDAQDNSATSYFVTTPPTIVVNPSTGAAGSTIQVIGSGFAAGQAVFFQVGSTIVTSIPAVITGPNFIAYVTVPAGIPGGDTVISATDAQNNAAVANFTVGGSSTITAINQAALSSTAATVNPSTGAPQTTFARGTSVKFSFVLETTAGSGNVVWGITLQQQDLTVTGLFTTTASISMDPTTLAYTNLLTSGVQVGTWTATIQIFGSDGVTPLAVTTLTFTVT